MDSLEYLSKTIELNEKWIITAERTVIILPKTLSHILNIPGIILMLCSYMKNFMR